MRDIETMLGTKVVGELQAGNIEDVRAKGIEYGKAIESLCYDGREKSLALTKLQESVMWAVKSIALEGE